MTLVCVGLYARSIPPQARRPSIACIARSSSVDDSTEVSSSSAPPISFTRYPPDRVHGTLSLSLSSQPRSTAAELITSVHHHCGWGNPLPAREPRSWSHPKRPGGRVFRRDGHQRRRGKHERLVRVGRTNVGITSFQDYRVVHAERGRTPRLTCLAWQTLPLTLLPFSPRAHSRRSQSVRLQPGVHLPLPLHGPPLGQSWGSVVCLSS